MSRLYYFADNRKDERIGLVEIILDIVPKLRSIRIVLTPNDELHVIYTKKKIESIVFREDNISIATEDDDRYGFYMDEIKLYVPQGLAERVYKLFSLLDDIKDMMEEGKE